MTGDLGAERDQVHVRAGANAEGVLAFWFALTSKQQFAKDDALDREIAARFADLRAEVVETRAAAWRDDAQDVLAAIILVDQFSRNLFRGQAEAFAHDDLAVELTLMAIERGWDMALPPEQRVFLYMPLMHAENIDLQRLSVEKFTALGIEENITFARDHAAVIERFGRFPSRNAALGRGTLPAEQAWLNAGGGW